MPTDGHGHAMEAEVPSPQTPSSKEQPHTEPAESTEIKPCPFCGAAPEIEPWHGGEPTKHRVGCENDMDCDVLPSVTGETREEAIAAWNRRAS